MALVAKLGEDLVGVAGRELPEQLDRSAHLRKAAPRRGLRRRAATGARRTSWRAASSSSREHALGRRRSPPTVSSSSLSEVDASSRESSQASPVRLRGATC